jgi:hypothetical protein
MHSFKVHVIVEYEGKHYREMREDVPKNHNDFIENMPQCNHINNIEGVVSQMGKTIRERIKERIGR